MVWKILVKTSVMARERCQSLEDDKDRMGVPPAQAGAIQAAKRLIQRYLEERAGRRMKSLEFLDSVTT